MLNNDGRYEFFIIEYKKKKDWKLLNSISKVNWGHRWENGKQLEPYATFSSGVEKIGIQGFSEVEQAVKLYCILMKFNPDCIFRIVKKTIWQDSEVLWCGQHKEYPALQCENL